MRAAVTYLLWALAGVVLFLAALVMLAVMARPVQRGYSSGRVVDLDDIPQPSPGPAPGASYDPLPRRCEPLPCYCEANASMTVQRRNAIAGGLVHTAVTCGDHWHVMERDG